MAAPTKVFQIAVKDEDVSFESPYSDVEAVEKLTQLFKDSKITSGFAASLISRKGKLSEKQTAWVHKLVVDHEENRYENIVALFEKAVQRLKQPKMVFDLPDCFVVLQRNTLGRYTDSVQVECMTTATRGYIDKQGRYHALGNSKTSPGVLRLLKQLNSDPVDFTATYGKLTGRCCYCHLPLTHANSLSVGYGQRCAGNYRLPWGRAAGKKDEVQEIIDGEESD